MSTIPELIRQLQGALGGNRIIRGNVSSAGAVVRGNGFTSAKTGTGLYTVTYTTAFASTPTVILGWGDTAGGGGAEIQSESETGFAVVTYNTASAVLNNSFSFIAAGP